MNRDKIGRYYCGHCKQALCKTTFHQHKRLYYDRLSKKWSSSRINYSEFEASQMPGSSSTAFAISSSESEEECTGSPFLDEAFSTEDQMEVCGVSPNLQLQNDSSSDNEDLTTELWCDGEDREIPFQLKESEGSQSVELHGALLRLYTFFLLMFQSLFRLSDAALNVLLTFLAMFFSTLTNTITTIPQAFISNLPRNVRSARIMAGSGRCKLQQFVCCPSCHSIYKPEDCVTLSGGERVPQRCSFAKFPGHPQIQHRGKCNTILMKKFKLSSGNVSIQPRLVFCYKSIIDSLQEMLKRNGFQEKCESWQQRDFQSLYRDVYDGQIWTDFLAPDNVPFLSTAHNYVFQLNVDWFQPFDHTQHSEGAMYMTILNLPREERFLQENVILVGVIPGPKEPQLHINSFLSPLVGELQQLWQGIPMQLHNGLPVLVRAALLCVGCDIPAARKVCGFVGHRALKGCSKCLLSFPTARFGEKGDYSNFDHSNCEPRTNHSHREIAHKYKQCNTRLQQHELECDYGIRYSVLLELPYFDAARMCVVDPMHNLLLGTAKHMVELWKNLGILTCKQYEDIQSRVDSCVCPSDIGRVPSKIASSFSGFTAEQWKNWTMFFSLFALKGILPREHYNCWHMFARACYLICRRAVTKVQVKEADKLLKEFCDAFVKLYGAEHCNMNMHLHLHLTECIVDYGPVYAFWCFAFERMNGVLGSYHTNNHNISVQLANRFLDSKVYSAINWPSEFSEEYFPVIRNFLYNKGSLMQKTVETEFFDKMLTITALPPIKECCFLPFELDSVKEALHRLIDLNTCSILLLHKRVKTLLIGGFVLGAKGSHHSRSSLVVAERRTSTPTYNNCLGEIQHFVSCVTLSNDTKQPHTVWLAAVKWFEEHQCKVWFGHPTQVWSTTDRPGQFYVPISDIKSRVVYSNHVVNFGRIIGEERVYVITLLEVL